MEESTDELKNSCSQNTLKNKRLNHWGYRKEKTLLTEKG
jgi:hypothetical protein